MSTLSSESALQFYHEAIELLRVYHNSGNNRFVHHAMYKDENYQKAVECFFAALKEWIPWGPPDKTQLKLGEKMPCGLSPATCFIYTLLQNKEVIEQVERAKQLWKNIIVTNIGGRFGFSTVRDHFSIGEFKVIKKLDEENKLWLLEKIIRFFSNDDYDPVTALFDTDNY